MSVRVGILLLELAIPHAQTLKEKRQAIRSLVDRLRARLPLVVAEVDHQDEHHRCTIAATTVNGDAALVERILREAVSMAYGYNNLQVLDAQVQVLAP